MLDQEAGRSFRTLWIRGVRTHYPGTPKESYIAPWESMAPWEQDSAIAVYKQVRSFLLAGVRDGQISPLTREQGGRLIRLAWVGQVYKYISDPKSAYVSDWKEMSSWEREVDMDIFEGIVASVREKITQESPSQ